MSHACNYFQDMFIMHVIIFRLYDMYEACDVVLGGVAVIDDYNKECSTRGAKPMTAALLGRVIATCFPKSMRKKRRKKGQWDKYESVYMGLRIRSYTQEDITEEHLLTLLQACLPDDFLFLKQTDKGFLIGHETGVYCQGMNVTYYITISNTLEIKVNVQDQDISLPEYGITGKLSSITRRSLMAFLNSIRSLKLCRGKNVDNKIKKNDCCVIVEWKDSFHTYVNKQSVRCKRLVSLHSAHDVCSYCHSIFINPQNEDLKKNPVTLLESTTATNKTCVSLPVPRYVVLPVPGSGSFKKIPYATFKDSISEHPAHIVNNPATEYLPDNTQHPEILFTASTSKQTSHSPVRHSLQKDKSFPVQQRFEENHHLVEHTTPKTSRFFHVQSERIQQTQQLDEQSTPKKSKFCDASVGTSPLRNSSDVLIKFFPYLQQQTSLLHLLSEQVDMAQKQDPRGRRYDKETLSLALTLWTRSPRNYQELLGAGILLPSARTLSLYKNCVNQKPGLNLDMLRWMYKEGQRRELTNVGYTGGLIMDEMNIQKDLQISNRGGDWTMIGFPDLGEGSAAMANMSKNKSNVQLADHVLQFLFHGLTGFRMPFACYPTNQANCCDLYLNVWDAVSGLKDWGFTIAYICLDGSSNNRSFIKMHFKGDPIDSDMLMINRADPSHQIAVIPDPSHVFKKIRNSIFNSGIDSCHTRHLLVNENHIEWRHWELAFEWCQDRTLNPVAPHPKLNKDHIYLTEAGKMRNAYAMEALNDNMLYLMESFKKSTTANIAMQLDGCIELLRQTSTLIRNFTDKRPIDTVQNPRIHENRRVFHWFKDWENNSVQKCDLLARECHQDILWMIVGFESFICETIKKHNVRIAPCDINSDIIENFFCSQRGIRGGNDTNPGLNNYLYNINSIVLGQASLSSKSNAGSTGTSALPYNFTTPVALRSSTAKRKWVNSDISDDWTLHKL